MIFQTTVSVLCLGLLLWASPHEAQEAGSDQATVFDDAAVRDAALGASSPDTVAMGVVRGRVEGESGEPLRKALVEFRSDMDGQSRVTHTDRHGRFLLASVPAGSGMVSVDHPGFVRSTGRVEVATEGVREVEIALEIDLEPLIATWLEEGNSHLERGEAQQARELFIRALTVVPDTGGSDIARALARTYYLEERFDEAADALRGSLLNAPNDPPTRRLLVELLDEAGRRAEAESWLEKLDESGARAALSSLPPRPPVDLAERPTGRFRTTLHRASPLSEVTEIDARLGQPDKRPGPAWDPSAESYEVYVPETRAPPVKGYGVVVWISPNPLGVIPDREIVPELEARGLIWIGANESGNQRPTLDRLRLALDGADAVSRFYPVDGQRVWVAGYSGGGRIASALVFHFPDVFSGALLYMGCNFYEPLASRQKPGLFWPPAFAPPTSSRQKKIERQSRVVLATAEFDFNRFQTRATRDAMKRRGFEHVLYLEVPAVGHFFGFQASPAREALAYLDGAADEP